MVPVHNGHLPICSILSFFFLLNRVALEALQHLNVYTKGARDDLINRRLKDSPYLKLSKRETCVFCPSEDALLVWTQF